MAALYPEDFQGAAPAGDDVIIISSDEDELMDDLSMTSVLDLQFSSEGEEEDEEISLMAKCKEMEMSAPIPISGLSCAVRSKEEIVPTGLPSHGLPTRPITPRPLFDSSYFSLGKGNGPILRDDRIRDGHPITLCRNLVPMVDTPLSPPLHERGPSCPTGSIMYCDAHGYQHQNPVQNIEAITKHFQGMGLSGTKSLAGYSDCVVCGKSVEQIKDEAVIDYMHKTAVPNESLQQFNARRMAFFEGMEIGTFLLLPGECRRLPPVRTIFTQLMPADRTPYLALYRYSKTVNALTISLKTFSYNICTVYNTCKFGLICCDNI